MKIYPINRTTKHKKESNTKKWIFTMRINYEYREISSANE